MAEIKLICTYITVQTLKLTFGGLKKIRMWGRTAAGTSTTEAGSLGAQGGGAGAVHGGRQSRQLLLNRQSPPPLTSASTCQLLIPT